MKYLIIDGMVSGSGIRDSVEGGYLRPEDLGLSTTLKHKITCWLECYEDAHYAGYKDEGIVAKLDAEGMEICSLVSSEVGESKVEYYSAAEMMNISIDSE